MASDSDTGGAAAAAGSRVIQYEVQLDMDDGLIQEHEHDYFLILLLKLRPELSYLS